MIAQVMAGAIHAWSRAPPGRLRAKLHHLLENAQIEAPYILVGASNGGLYVRSYAADYPQEVAGLVLVDGTSEAELDKIKGLPGEIFAVMGRLGIFRLFPDMICPGSACDETAKPMIAAFRGRASLYQTVDDEWAALQASDALAILRERLSPPASLSDTPLVILRATSLVYRRAIWTPAIGATLPVTVKL